MRYLLTPPKFFEGVENTFLDRDTRENARRLAYGNANRGNNKFKICRRAFFASSLSHQNQAKASPPGVQRVTRARQIAIFSEINFFDLSV